MKKSERKLLSETLDKALAPPSKRRPPALASRLGDYDDEPEAAPPPPAAPAVREMSAPAVEETGAPPQGETRPTPSDGETPPPPLAVEPKGPVAPDRDFNRRANSLERIALPSGLFPGASKKIYDALYVRTRGAVKPSRTIRGTKRDLAQWSGVNNRKTIDMHLRYLETAGLIERKWELGNPEGYLFEVRLLEETPLMDRGTEVDSPLGWTDQKRVRGTDQKRDSDGQSKTIDNIGTYEIPNTIKTNTYDDDDEAAALSDLVSVFSEATLRLTGRRPRPSEREQWGELARMIVGELEGAAERAESVSSVPAFLAEHLRRKFAPRPAARRREVSHKSDPGAPATPPPDPNRRLTPEEIAEQARLIAEVVAGGYSIEQAEAQFGGSFHPEDWARIRAEVGTLSEQKGIEQ